MSKKKLLAYALIPAIGLGILGASSASAHGLFGGFGIWNASPEEIATRQQSMFEHQAKVLGLSVDEIKSAWSEGKSMQQVIQEKGISQEQVESRIKQVRLDQFKTQLDTLVSKGVITQSQADSRLKFMQTQAENSKGKMGRMHRGFWF